MRREGLENLELTSILFPSGNQHCSDKYGRGVDVAAALSNQYLSTCSSSQRHLFGPLGATFAVTCRPGHGRTVEFVGWS